MKGVIFFGVLSYSYKKGNRKIPVHSSIDTTIVGKDVPDAFERLKAGNAVINSLLERRIAKKVGTFHSLEFLSFKHKKTLGKTAYDI